MKHEETKGKKECREDMCHLSDMDLIKELISRSAIGAVAVMSTANKTLNLVTTGKGEQVIQLAELLMDKGHDQLIEEMYGSSGP